MTITLIAAGSRGDIQPFVALGVRLKREGHAVRVCAPELFRPLIEANGLPYATMNDEFLRLTDTSAGKDVFEGKGGKSFGLIAQAKPMIRKMLDDAWVAAQDASLILYHPKILGAPYMGEALGVPAVMSMALPVMTPTSAYPNPVMPPSLKLGGLFNRLSYKIIAVSKAPFVSVLNDWRRDALNLPPVGMFSDDLRTSSGGRIPVLYAYSPHVIPPPPDYPPEVHVTGYWFLDTPNWQPPADLEAFLGAGDAPVYIGFGSMVKRDPAAMTRLVIDAVRQAGVRAVLATGWGAMGKTDLPDGVFMLESAPHDWLFPRMAAAVHHGGAGTTAAALRAGLPSLIAPFIADQPFWGAKVHELGVGAAPIPQSKLIADSLAAAIRQITSDAEMQHRARALGEAIRAEDGTGRAAALLGEMLPGRVQAAVR